MDRLSYEAKIPIFQRMGYVPNELQMPIHIDLNGFVLVSGGWRAGKSVILAAEGVPHCLIPSASPYLIAVLGPTYTEPREEIGYMIDWLEGMLPNHQFNRTRDVSFPKEGRVEFTIPAQRTADGELVHFATVRSYTADEAVRIRAFNADAVLIAEAGGISEEAFFAIMGRVLSTGGFVLGSGTLEESLKWYHNAIKEGRYGISARGITSHILPSWANRVVFPEGRQDPKILRIEALLPARHFAVRIGAEPVRVSGLCIQEATEENIGGAEFDPALPVELAIDPGFAGAYAVLAIQYGVGGNIRIIDEVYMQFHGTPDVVEECKKREWWGNVDETMPGVIDRAAKQHSSTDGMNVLELWDEHAGLWMDLTEAVIPVPTSIEQLNIHFKANKRIQVNAKCAGILGELDLADFPEEMENFEPWQFKKDVQGRLSGEKAVKGANHSLTALAYWLIHRFGFVTPDTMDYGPYDVVPWRKQRLVSEYGSFELEHVNTLGRSV